MFTNRPSPDSLAETMLKTPTPKSVTYSEKYNVEMSAAEKKKIVEEIQKEEKEEDEKIVEEESKQESSSFAKISRIAIVTKHPMFPSIEKRWVGDVYGAPLTFNATVEVVDEDDAEVEVKPVIKKEEVNSPVQEEFYHVFSRDVTVNIYPIYFDYFRLI